MAALTFAEGAARFLSFGFYLVAARLLTTGEFGVVRYTIALSLLAFAGLQVLVTGLLRELGAGRADPERAPAAIGTTLAAAGVVLVGSLALCAIAGAAGLTGSADLLGLIVCLAGLSVFQLYYAAARGLGDPRRAVIAYAGGSLVQLVACAVALAIHPTVSTALLVFGLSSLAPILVCELYRPILRRLSVSADVMRRLRALSGPLLVAQVGFLVWLTADLVWVDRTLGERELGLYGAAKTVAQVLIILPAGVAGALLPRVAELRAAGRSDTARRLVYGAGAGLLVITLAVVAIVIAGRSTVLEVLFGDAYGAASPALVGLALGMAAYAAFVGLTEGAVGWGRPRVYSAGIVVAAVAEVLVLVSLSEEAGISAAAWASAGSMALGLGTVVLLVVLRPLREDPTT
jgi:O-antigen/teichoic acid export membrane protein